MPQSVSFNDIAADIRAPGVFIEFDSSKAIGGALIKPYKVLLVGQRLTAGTVAQLVPKQLTSADQARGYFGAGSMLHNMAEKFFLNDHEFDVVGVAVDDAGAGVAATKALVVTATSVGAGTVSLLIGGRQVKVKVAALDTANTIAANLAAAITAIDGIGVTAGAATATVTLTARHKGVEGNQIEVRANYYDGEVYPTGLSISNVPSVLAGGTTNPTLGASLWSVVGDIHYDVMVIPFTDAANMTEVDRELKERWGPTRQIEGIAFAAKNDTLANLTSFGSPLNSKHVTVLGAKGIPNPPWESAAAYGAVASFHLRNDPARGIRTIQLKGILPPAVEDRFKWSERDLLYRDGIASIVVGSGGEVQIDRAVTMYQKSAGGADDTAFLDITTPATLGYLRWDYRRRWVTKYPRHKLAQDGTRFGSGQPVITPKVASAEALTAYEQWEERGLVDDFKGFKRDLISVLNAQDPTRIDQVLPVRLVNPFYVLAAQIQFIL